MNLDQAEQAFYDGLIQAHNLPLGGDGHSRILSALSGFKFYLETQRGDFERLGLAMSQAKPAYFDALHKAEEIAEILEDIRAVYENRTPIDALRRHAQSKLSL